LSAHRLRDEYRSVLRVPLGVALFKPPEVSAEIISELVRLLEPPLLVTVGDFVTANLVRAGLEPHVAVVDLRTRREGFAGLASAAAGRERLRCSNPPGTLTEEAVEAVRGAVARALSGARTLVVVDGEEDLLALPALALAPAGSLVVYGLWLGAAVAVPCHPAVSRAAARILREAFEPPVALTPSRG